MYLKTVLAIFVLSFVAVAQDTLTVTVTPPQVSIATGTGLTITGKAVSSTKSAVANFSWNFGDGTTCIKGNAGCFMTLWHVFKTAGTFTATLSVTDVAGTTSTGSSTVTVLDDNLTAQLILANGNNQSIGLGVQYIWSATSSTGALSKVTLNCGDGTSQVQDLATNPPAGSTLTIIGLNSATTSSTCYPVKVGQLKPTLAVRDSLGKTVSVPLSPVNITQPVSACATSYPYGYTLPSWYLTAYPGVVTWMNPGDVMYGNTQYATGTFPITGWSSDGTNATFQLENIGQYSAPYTAGTSVTLNQFKEAIFLNSQKVTVLGVGLSKTQFSVVLPASSKWQASHAYALNATILDSASHIQSVTVAGTSGTTQPIFNDEGSMVTDGSVTWTDQGAVTSTDTGSVSGPVLNVIQSVSTSLGTTYTLKGWGHQYCNGLQVGGGTPPYTFTAQGLPPGLTITPLTSTVGAQAVLNGVATTPGYYQNISLTVTDSKGATATLPNRTMLVCNFGEQCGLPASLAVKGNSVRK